MLREWIAHLTTPCPRHLRDMGYLREQVGLKARHRRCRGAWEPHLAACKGLILEAADRCSGHRRAVVLGSGHLYDVPLEELSSRFDEVVLVDILHPPAARRRAAGLANVRTEVRDVSGVVEAVWAAAREGGQRPPPAPPGPVHGEADLLVSANMLSQLPLLPREYLDGRGGNGGLWRALVEDHLAGLEAFPGVACLIADIERLVCDDGKVIERRDLLEGVDLNYPGRQWTWDIAPRPEEDRNRDIRHRVAGVVEVGGGGPA